MKEIQDRLIKRKDSILVIVDVQEKLIPVINDSRKVIDNIVKLIRFANIIGMPVVASEQEKLGSTIGEIKRELPDLVPISKIEFSAYRSSKFIKKLDGFSRSNIILTGIETHICIVQTALDLLSGYNVHVVADATSSRNIEDKNTALQRLYQSGVTVSTAEMVIYELLEKAGTDEFREVLNLIKGK